MCLLCSQASNGNIGIIKMSVTRKTVAKDFQVECMYRVYTEKKKSLPCDLIYYGCKVCGTYKKYIIYRSFLTIIITYSCCYQNETFNNCFTFDLDLTCNISSIGNCGLARIFTKSLAQVIFDTGQEISILPLFH